MTGVDTNVLVRYLVQDDPEQSLQATRFFELRTAADPALVNVIVVCELVWVLTRAYGYRREAVLDVIERLSGVAEVELTERDTVLDAVQSCRRTGADLPDLLIERLNRAAGADTTVTFDRAAAHRAGLSLLS